ncbi:hypothetical protein VPHD148_0046 [Vibrio phage D148]
MASFWAKIQIMKRKARSTFGNRSRMDGREEYILKLPGWSGELRKHMTEEEAESMMESYNKKAFCEAAEASKDGLYGYERFTQYGNGDNGMKFTMMRAASRAFADTRKEKK